MHRKLRATGWLLLLSALSNATVAASGHPAHEPHVHGIATLNIVLENHDVHLALESPAVNLIGFEHAPVTAEQKTVFHATRQILSGPTRLFALPDAGCQLMDSDIQMPEIHSHADGGDDHDHHEKHADIHANYRFQCSRIVELNEIRMDLFAIFPGIQQIKAQWVTGRSQGSQLLTPAANRLKLNYHPLKVGGLAQLGCRRLKSSTRTKLNAHESTHLKSKSPSKDGGFYQIYGNQVSRISNYSV